MSNEEVRAKLGQLVLDRQHAREQVKTLGDKLGLLATRLVQLGSAMQVRSDGHLADERGAWTLIHEMPDELCNDYLRQVVSDYKDALARLAAIESQLRPYEEC